MLIHSSVPTLPPNTSIPSLSLSPPTPSGETSPGQAVACENTATANLVDREVNEAPVTETALGEQGKRIQPLRVNYLSQTAHRSVTNR